MSTEHGRGAFSELPVQNKLPFWRRAIDCMWEDFRHQMGHPAALERAIDTGQLVPLTLKEPANTFWTRSVVHWHTWMESSTGSYWLRPYTLDYRKPGYDRRLEFNDLPVPEVEQLVREEVVHAFACDITDIRGISASKSGEHDITDIDEFPMRRCTSLAEPVTVEHLQKNMRHGELRLDRMCFAEYPWTERRFYWLNNGGSHHFGAARYQAVRLNTPVPLTGTLYRYRVNLTMIAALRNKWHMYLLQQEEVFGSFYNAMNAFECPFGNGCMPRNMHDDRKKSERLQVIWLERGHPKADAVAGVLARAGFPDFGTQLDFLAECVNKYHTETSERLCE